ncbi:Protein kinase-like protein [Gracilaria domingensis]|nr:Protein kinase-like protein [Gracilaria domingensis]
MSDQGERIWNETNREDFSKLLIELGKFQLESMQHIEALKEFGLAVESSDSLIRQTEVMLGDETVRNKLAKCEEFESTSKDGLADVELHRKALNELLRELYDDGKCPLTLTHGDVTGNVLKDHNGNVALFDWGAAKIDIPICDTYCFDVCSMAMEEYLSLWEKYASVPELMKLLEHVTVTGLLGLTLESYDGDGESSSKGMSDEDVKMLAWLLVKSKEVVDKRNL